MLMSLNVYRQEKDRNRRLDPATIKYKLLLSKDQKLHNQEEYPALVQNKQDSRM